MQNLSIKAGTTDVSVVIRIVDSTDGTPETGVTSATGGLDLEYRREGAVSTDITEADLTNLNDAHSDGGLKHIGNGYYRLDLPDAACATGVRGVLVHGVATGMVVVGSYINLTPVPADHVQTVGHAIVFGTLSGTHSATTADLGTAAPAQDISGQTLVFPDDGLSRVVESYNTGTGVATFASVAVTLTNGDNWFLVPSAPSPTTSIPDVNVTKWLGTAAATPTVAGVPEVDVTHVAGAAQDIATATALAAVDTMVDNILTLIDNAPAEPGSIPAYSSSLNARVNYILARLMNKSTFNKDTGAFALRNAADSANISTRTDSNDGTTYTKAKDT